MLVSLGTLAITGFDPTLGPVYTAGFQSNIYVPMYTIDGRDFPSKPITGFCRIFAQDFPSKPITGFCRIFPTELTVPHL